MTSSSPRETYHHGDLRRALLDAALETVEREGHEAVSLTGLADAVGVAKSAPYRHFESRDALLAAVAARAFELWMQDMRHAVEGLGPGQVVRRGSEAVLAFAGRRPNLFRLMFRSDVLVRDGGPMDELKGPADLAYRRFEATIGAVMGEADAGTVKAATLAVWSATFGFAVLTAEGRIKPFMREPLSPEDVRERVLDMIGAMPTLARGEKVN